MRQEEQHRSKRRSADLEKLKEQREKEKQYKDILREMKWEDVRSALGLQPGTKQYDAHYKIWRAYRAERAAAEQQQRER